MQKKIIISGLLIFMFSLVSFGQPAKIKKGEKHYEYYSYSKSIEKFEEISDKTIEMKRQLADSYFRTGDYYTSEQYYAEVVKSDEKTSEDVYNYAYVLSMREKYQEAEKWMKKYNEMEPSDTRGKLYVENTGFFSDLQDDKGVFTIKNLSINSAEEDFGTSYFKNQVVFSSSRTEVKPIKRKWNWNNLPFLDLYVADVDSRKQLSGVGVFKKKFNKKFHEGPVAFNDSGNYMVLTRNNYKKRSSDGVFKLKMFYAPCIDGKWKKPQPMPFNNKEYSVGHATLTADGQTMYFASDMPGGIGGVDIYVSKREGETWGVPVNLGSEINTEGDEMFPFIHPDGYLFFSSNGWLGLGGLDVFTVKFEEDGFGEVQNLGTPISSNFDDFAFILDNKMETGYFSSNREGGKGDDDIYVFTMKAGKIIKGIAKDINGNILSNVDVELYDEDGKVVETITVADDGAYEFKVDADKIYKLNGEKIEYKKGENSADTHTSDYIIYADLVLQKIPEFSIYCLITDAENGTPLDSVSIILTNNHTTEEEIIITTTTGDFARELEGLDLNDSISYTLKLERRGYMAKDFTYRTKLDHEGQYNMHDDLKMEPLLVGLDISDLIDMKPIYFDTGKHNIRPDAATELDKVVAVMEKYPTMEIELAGHTDCRGSSSSNKSLSDRRAKSAAQYIKDRITNPNRINGKGYGEDKLIVPCACKNGKAHNLTKPQHQENRRTEFTIIKM